MAVEEFLQPDEQVGPVCALAQGAHPLSPLIPIVGWISLFVSKSYAFVATDRRLFVLRTSPWRGRRGASIVQTLDLNDVRVVRYSGNGITKRFVIDLKEKRVKLYVVPPFSEDMPGLIALFGSRARPST